MDPAPPPPSLARDVNADAQVAAHADVDAATLGQRQRSAALVILMVGLAVGGAVVRVSSTGSAPVACDVPAIVDGVLVCRDDARAADARGDSRRGDSARGDSGRGDSARGVGVGARAWLTGGKLDVNTATARELEAIPDVGPSLARAIVDERDRRGGFASFEELDAVNGVGAKTLAKLRAYVEYRSSSPR